MKTGKTVLFGIGVCASVCLAFGDRHNEIDSCGLAQPLPAAYRPQGKEALREALLAIADTHYCGSGMAEGLGTRAAMSGDAPVEGAGFIQLGDEDWAPVAMELAADELGMYKQLLAEGKTEAANERIGRLEHLVLMIGWADDEHDQALDFLERFAKDPIGDGTGFAVDLVPGFWNCWFRQADLANGAGAERCVALGRWMAERRGVESRLLCQYRRVLLAKGLAKCKGEESYAALARHALQLVEEYQDVNNCRMFDKQAVEGGLKGWVGSMQRRQLAARFPDEPIPRFQYFDATRQEMVYGDTIESLLPFMLNRRAVSELAAGEDELTDLKQVYGDWTKDRTDE